MLSAFKLHTSSVLGLLREAIVQYCQSHQFYVLDTDGKQKSKPRSCITKYYFSWTRIVVLFLLTYEIYGQKTLHILYVISCILLGDSVFCYPTLCQAGTLCMAHSCGFSLEEVRSSLSLCFTGSSDLLQNPSKTWSSTVCMGSWHSAQWVSLLLAEM